MHNLNLTSMVFFKLYKLIQIVCVSDSYISPCRGHNNLKQWIPMCKVKDCKVKRFPSPLSIEQTLLNFSINTMNRLLSAFCNPLMVGS